MKQDRVAAGLPWHRDLAGVEAAARIHGPWRLGLHGLATAAAYVTTFKMRSVLLNTFSALTGMLLAAGTDATWGIVTPLITSGGLVAAGCGALNSYLDRDIDGAMPRTARRPLPTGRIHPPEKVLYAGVLLVTLGVIVSMVWLNWLVTLTIASGAAIYVFVYTLWLKRRTPWSVVVGGLAGSFALLAGWFSASSRLGLAVLLFGLFVFLWTPGHFWGLAIWRKEVTEGARVPTLPHIYGDRMASRWAALSNLVLVPLSAIPYALGILGETYLLITLAVGLPVVAANVRLYVGPTPRRARAVFRLSSPYLAVVYLAVVADLLLT